MVTVSVLSVVHLLMQVRRQELGPVARLMVLPGMATDQAGLFLEFLLRQDLLEVRVLFGHCYWDVDHPFWR